MSALVSETPRTVSLGWSSRSTAACCERQRISPSCLSVIAARSDTLTRPACESSAQPRLVHGRWSASYILELVLTWHVACAAAIATGSQHTVPAAI